MNANSRSSENGQELHSGSRKLNRILVLLGVLAFILVVTDRVIEAFRAGDTPNGVVLMETVPQDVQDKAVDPLVASDIQADLLDEFAMPGAQALETLEALFGSPVVLVSAAEPSYVVTGDARRFDVGEVINKGTTLAGVTSHQLIFEQSGDLLVISLPDPME